MTGKSRLDLKAQILVHPAAAHIILAVPATANPTLTPESKEDEARPRRPPGHYIWHQVH